MIPTTPLGTRLTSTRVRPGHDAELALRCRGARGRCARSSGRSARCARLVEGVLAGLAGLPHDQVDDLVLAVEHEVVQAQQRGRALVERACAPRPPGPAGPARRPRATSASRRLRDVRERLAVERRERPARSRPRSRRSGGSATRRSRARGRTTRVGSCSGSAGPSTRGPPAGFWRSWTEVCDAALTAYAGVDRLRAVTATGSSPTTRTRRSRVD